MAAKPSTLFCDSRSAFGFVLLNFESDNMSSRISKAIRKKVYCSSCTPDTALVNEKSEVYADDLSERSAVQWISYYLILQASGVYGFPT